ncbi:hypothetical protein BEWA_022580 [Theileria equi strain WA]|uniref:Cysteine protease n=1 Tax=Theileria equi strain WA TaxID=1537102 RepID=L0AV50_THEEQ|nr:hypothetical protein BEWA_022580 [Theileria equi strain WA]AFZ79410.1 hypothetical protein BEWA_022580 [Theileria equi strain WA]|eukprot:XP_004829076.1 hypothetical protein BEWA_022580 [Theileria equi strain WA]
MYSFLVQRIDALVWRASCVVRDLYPFWENEQAVVLGSHYSINYKAEYRKFKRKITGILLFTYRSDLNYKVAKPIGLIKREHVIGIFKPFNVCLPSIQTIDTDKGWGCVIRATQMALAQTLISLILGDNFDIYSILKENTLPDSSGGAPSHRRSDRSGKSENFDNIITDGYQNKYDAFCSILSQFYDSRESKFSLYKFIIADSVLKTCTKFLSFGPTSSAICVNKMINDANIPLKSIAFPDGVFYINEVYKGFNKNRNVIVWLSLNKKLDKNEKVAVRSLFLLKQFNGIVGGNMNNRAYYICGCSSSRLYYVDPHVSCKPAFTTLDGVDILKDFTSKRVHSMRWRSLNPSMSIVFLFKGLGDFEVFLDSTFRNGKYTESYPFEFIQ